MIENSQNTPKKQSITTILSLIISNAIPMVGVMFAGWSASEILLIYWAESGIIGFYNLLKMGRSGFYTKPGKSRVAQWGITIFLSLFFIIHYGGFMTGHLIFLVGVLDVDLNPLLMIVEGGNLNRLFAETGLSALMAMFISHGISFKKHFLGKKLYIKKSPENFIAAPYARIIIMHITILGGAFFVLNKENANEDLGLIAILISLKTTIDAISHYIEHREKKRV